MNISHKNKYLYFVIPKCASSTIRHTLYPFTDIGYPKNNFEQHVKISDFMKTKYSKLFNEYFKFTFVRNPYDKIFSGYLQDKKAASTVEKWSKVKTPIFEEVNYDFNLYFKEFVAKNDIINDWQYICFCPMKEFATINEKYCLDWFGRVESIDEDLCLLMKILNINFKKSKDMNVNTPFTGSLKYVSKYEKSTVSLINEIYSKDFELFGYEKLDPSNFPEKL